MLKNGWHNAVIDSLVAASDLGINVARSILSTLVCFENKDESSIQFEDFQLTWDQDRALDHPSLVDTRPF